MQDQKIPNESFVFYRSFWGSIKNQPLETRDRILTHIFNYAFDGITPPEAPDIVWSVFNMAKAQIDANFRKRIDGAKGGRPKRSGSSQTEAETG